ncbi:MAG: Hpt domain-containing protein [Nitrospinae bacterium]|nr:Hpt domain-containing protein [Nitrospinota bacterium]
MDEDFEDIIQEFMIESTEGLDQLDRDLVALEQDPESKETIASIFRTVHTIKGTSGFLSFSKLEKVAHAGENLLSLIRDGKLKVHIGIVNTLLSMGDAIREMLDHLRCHHAVN